MIDINFILNLMSINNNITLIGSSINKKLKYKTDYDCQEIIENLNKNEAYNRFKKMFKEVKKFNYIYITDFKSGLHNTIPLRWGYDEIMKGFQMIDNKPIYFVDTLNNNLNNIIKIDLLVFDESTKTFLEFSCNYYVAQIQNDDIVKSLILDVRKYYFDGKYMKLLKRIYSYNLLKNHKNTSKKLESIFNSKAGLLNQLYHKVNLIMDAIKFNVKKYQINQVIKELKQNIDSKYKKYVKISSLEKLAQMLKDDTNNLIFELI